MRESGSSGHMPRSGRPETRPTYSIVVPVSDEEESIGELGRRPGDAVPGDISIVAVIRSIGEIQLLVLGAIGTYVARMFEELKRRPLYVVQETYGLDEERLERLPAAARDSEHPGAPL